MNKELANLHLELQIASHTIQVLKNTVLVLQERVQELEKKPESDKVAPVVPFEDKTP